MFDALRLLHIYHIQHQDERSTTVLTRSTSGGNPNVTIVNEPGLYSLVLGSRKPEAKVFKRWITHEVIVDIRKHGMYATPQAVEAMLADPDTMILTLQELKKEREARMAAEQREQEAKAVVVQQTAVLEEQKPLVEHAQHMLKSPDNLRIRDFVQALCTDEINIGEKRLFSLLRWKGILKDAEYNNDRKKNTPYQQYINERKLEGWYKYNKIRAWGLKNPIEFQRQFMKIEMLDLQKYVFINTWNADFAAWLMCRNAGKTTVGSLYTMTRSILLPFHATYFLGKTGGQSKEVYRKIEQISKKQIESFTGSTEFFLEELDTRGPVGDGFGHDPASFRCELFNGSSINTLNSDPDNVRGKRGNLVFFDEAGWFSDELFIQGENFANQDSNFKMGIDVDMRLEPKSFSRQLVYASSASDTESGFYTKVKNFCREMMMGNTKYFVCNFDVNVIMNATLNGEPYGSLIEQSKVDKMMREDPDKAMRELFNKFTSGAYEGQILTPRMIMNRTKPVPPTLFNDGTKRYMMAWDSARMHDNSIVVIAEVYNDPDKGWCMHLDNVVSFVDAKKKERTPKPFPEQIRDFRQLLLDYNGTQFGKLDYENIEAVLGDVGSGGGMYGIADEMLHGWVDIGGNEHKGIIDLEHDGYCERASDFPDAVDIFHLIEPRKYRNEIYRAISDMVKLGVVTFPAEYDDMEKEYLPLIDDEGNEVRYDLTLDEQISLVQIEALKREAITMCRYVNGDAVTYNYPPDLRNKMHDDRVFAFGLLCFWLSKLRHGQAVAPKKVEIDVDTMPVTVSRAYWGED